MVVEKRGDQLCSWAATAAARYSSFEAETVAATEVAWKLARQEDTGGFGLVTDSSSLVRAKEGESEEGRLGVLRSVLWALRQKSWTMKILWVPGHYFLGENERSEEEARRGGRSELSREESVNLSLQVRPPHGPRQLVLASRKTLFCGGQILWRGE